MWQLQVSFNFIARKYLWICQLTELLVIKHGFLRALLFQFRAIYVPTYSNLTQLSWRFTNPDTQIYLLTTCLNKWQWKNLMVFYLSITKNYFWLLAGWCFPRLMLTQHLSPYLWFSFFLHSTSATKMRGMSVIYSKYLNSYKQMI